MELRHLKTFVVVAEVRGFTKAAEILGYAQSSVTNQIQTLEEEFEQPLFDRLGKSVVLTDTGNRLLPYAHEMLRLQANMKQLVQASEAPSGTLTIGAPESLAAYRLPAVIKEYKRLYPQVKIILKPGACWEMRSQLRSGQIDFAFTLEPPSETADMFTEALVDEPLVLVTSLDHPLTVKSEVKPTDLQNETLLNTEPGCSYRGLFEKYLQEHGIEPSVTMEFWNIEAIKNCVMSGLGISILPFITVQTELHDGKIAALKWDAHNVRVSTLLLCHKAKWISPAVQEFLRLVRQHAETWNQRQEH
ncbi:LysR family transcriptional regulator [Alicyclobacillus dauci]|uniref:LysR family transcriptional regulator n=1 Tax=Alicyclobacillus dauci TaxID=1475485 RepID=A0ABY6Z086_9BACL|nr:LysR family transcriptional regulator [Alicyclobacillus dauci]WAH36297.1 LysR family transcriptional regulator [Alicyclobacillus dauci]